MAQWINQLHQEPVWVTIFKIFWSYIFLDIQIRNNMEPRTFSLSVPKFSYQNY